MLSNRLEKLCSSSYKTLKWTDNCNENFIQLKNKLISAPVLAYPDFKKSFILDTDACFDCIGAVLSQVDDHGREKVVSYGSHSLSKHELGYCVTRKELLAIYYFVNHFKHYLYGRRFKVRTDHKAITFMMKTKIHLTAQFQTWIGFLSGLDIEFAYRNGNKHTNADVLSRPNCTSCSQCQMEHANASTSKLKTKVLNAISEDVLKWQRENDEIEGIRNEIREKCSIFVEDEGIIRNANDKIWIPLDKRIDFVKDVHLKLCHAGLSKCLDYVKDDFDMHEMSKVIKNFIDSCEICQKRKTFTGKTKEEPITRSDFGNFEIIFVDFCGPFTMTKFGRKYILAVIDSKSKYILLKAVNTQDELTLVNVLLYDWILKFGAPKILHSDCGKSFVGKEILKLSKQCGFDLEFSSPYHHSSNGQIERQLRAIRDSLITRMNDTKSTDWAKALPDVEYMMNATLQKTIGMSPAEAVFGRKLRRINSSRSTAKFDEKATVRTFQVGEKVWVKKEMKNKEDDRFEGPATIEQRIHPRSYQIFFNDGRRIRRNVEWLKPFKTRGV